MSATGAALPAADVFTAAAASLPPVSATGAAFLAGALAAVAAADLLPALAPGRGRAAAAGRSLLAAGADGRDPGSAERRRALAAGAVAAFGLGAWVFGPVAGLAAAAAGPAVVARLLRARRRRYRAAVERDAGVVASALADALAGGHSLRGAIGQAAAGVDGPAGRELARTAGELALGATTDDALAGLAARTGGPAIAAVAAACLLQRRAGGDLAALLRRSAESFEDQRRLAGEVKAATAQARFTALVVMGMPLGGAVLAELASPGFAAGLMASPLTAWLAGMALAMQAGAWFAIRRLARVEP